MKKYILTNETLFFAAGGKKTLYRIEAICDFGDVKKGDKGGFIESEKNLSQNGDCWVYNGAIVSGDVTIKDNAKVKDGVTAYTRGKNTQITICDNAVISGYVTILGNTHICDNAVINGEDGLIIDSIIKSNAKVSGKFDVRGLIVYYDINE